MESNRDLIKKYPWLKIEDNTGEINCTLLDLLPYGWRGLILDMCAEIKDALPKALFDKYQVVEAKEKWYTLRWYDCIDGFGNMPDKITDIVCRYEDKSREVCMICGNFKNKNEQLCSMCSERYL